MVLGGIQVDVTPEYSGSSMNQTSSSVIKVQGVLVLALVNHPPRISSVATPGGLAWSESSVQPRLVK